MTKHPQRASRIDRYSMALDGMRGSGQALLILLAISGSAGSFAVPMVALAILGDTWASVLAVGVVAALTTTFILISPKTFLFYWIGLALFQNVFSGLLAHFTNLAIPLAVTEAKSVAVVVAFAIASPALFRLSLRYRAIAICLALYFLLVLVSFHQVTSTSLAYLRNFAFPILFLLALFAISSKMGREGRLSLARDLTYLTAAVLAVGAILEFVLGTSTWRAMFNTGQNETLNSLAETTKLFGISLPRLGGFLFEPINQGYLAASVLVSLFLLLLLTDTIKSKWLFTIFVACGLTALVLAAAKNGALMFAMLLIAVILVMLGCRAWLVLAVTSGMALITTLSYSALLIGPRYFLDAFIDPVGSIGYDSSTFHVAGLVSGIERSLTTFPFGHGLGNGGNFSKLELTDPTREELTNLTSTGAESAWGVLAFQSGIIALALFLVAFCLIAQRLGQASTVLIAVWLSAAMFSEAFFGPLSAALLLINIVLFRGVSTHSLLSRILSHKAIQTWRLKRADGRESTAKTNGGSIQ